ncbi:hypothetical protein NQ314_016945 [Rhamnusium bicolor]|uniref:EF-hand domain-containing protein n=1 Tax=Rhamnusium bicolor TaxID=1586634 RepID=A0AAV8WUL4_9CUCU|nr:hypothetical protein NQ314_016945 [Rhamnusium bicolor]
MASNIANMTPFYLWGNIKNIVYLKNKVRTAFQHLYPTEGHRATQTEAPPAISTSEEPNYIENEIEDSMDEKEDKSDLYYDKEDCSMQEYEIMKDNLLLYNHARLMSQDNHSKDYLVSIMFSHYDRNNNGNLEATELNEIAVQERLDTISSGCSLSNMIQYDDADHDGKLSINEFYVAFSKLYSK